MSTPDLEQEKNTACAARDEALRAAASLRLDLKHAQSNNERLRRIITAAEKDVADLKAQLACKERGQGVGPFRVGDRVRRRGREDVQRVTGVVQCGPSVGHIYVDSGRPTGHGPADPAEYESVAPAASADEDECGRCGGSGIDPADSTAEAPCSNCRVPHDGAASRLDWQRIYDRGYEDARTAAERAPGTPQSVEVRVAALEELTASLAETVDGLSAELHGRQRWDETP